MKAKLRQLKDGEWYEQASKIFYHTCCDCELTHKVELDYNDAMWTLWYRWTRDNRRTAQKRRRKRAK